MYKILLTAIGCPNGITAIKHLQRYGVCVVGADAHPTPVAASLVETFYQIPLARNESFLKAIRHLIRLEKPDVLVSQSEEEVEVLSQHADDLDTCVMVSSPDAVRTVMDKWATYEKAKKLGIPVPRSNLCVDSNALLRTVTEYVKELGSAVVRPARGKGSRGLRVVVPVVDRMSHDWRRWPGVVLTSLAEIESSDLDAITYPMIVSEREYGEVAYEGYCANGKMLTGFLKHKSREVHNGHHTYNRSVDILDLAPYACEMVKDFGGHSFVDVQFVGGKLMEINPRLSTLIYTPEYNMIHFGILHALGMMTDAEIAEKRLPLGKTAEFHWDVHYA